MILRFNVCTIAKLDLSGERYSMCDADCKLGNQMPKLETWVECIYYKILFDFFFFKT